MWSTNIHLNQRRIAARIAKTFLVLWLVSSSFALVKAQDDGQLTLRLSRNFGYSSGTGDIQGTFTMKVDGPEDLTRVVFYIDDQVIGEAAEPPYQVRFKTGEFPLGVHTLSAAGYTSQGTELHSNQQRRNFVPAEVGMQTAGKILLPLLGIVLLVVVFSIAIPALVGRRRKDQLPMGAQRSYGLLGGTVCPKCGRSFGMHFWGLNLPGGKLDRCPHCGKWSLVRRVAQAELQRAEAAELADADSQLPINDSVEERMRRDLEESRYQDLD